jgi:hypothetical protein
MPNANSSKKAVLEALPLVRCLASEEETYPRMEALARMIPVPLTVCPVTKELYGYATPVFDRAKAERDLKIAYLASGARWTE